MNDPRLRKPPPCVCTHSEPTHEIGGRCVHPECRCLGYWPGGTDASKAVRPVPPGHTRPVA